MKEYIVPVGDKGNMNMIENELHLQQLVRCNDCKHWNSKKNECHNINSYMQYRPCFGNWFCADGEQE